MNVHQHKEATCGMAIQAQALFQKDQAMADSVSHAPSEAHAPSKTMAGQACSLLSVWKLSWQSLAYSSAHTTEEVEWKWSSFSQHITSSLYGVCDYENVPNRRE